MVQWNEPERETIHSHAHERLNTMTTATMNPPELLTKKQVAELLQCSQRQVELLTAKGRISKPVYLGENSPRWKRAELLASLEANQAAT